MIWHGINGSIQAGCLASFPVYSKRWTVLSIFFIKPGIENLSFPLMHRVFINYAASLPLDARVQKKHPGLSARMLKIVLFLSNSGLPSKHFRHLPSNAGLCALQSSTSYMFKTAYPKNLSKMSCTGNPVPPICYTTSVYETFPLNSSRPAL